MQKLNNGRRFTESWFSYSREIPARAGETTMAMDLNLKSQGEIKDEPKAGIVGLMTSLGGRTENHPSSCIDETGRDSD